MRINSIATSELKNLKLNNLLELCLAGDFLVTLFSNTPRYAVQVYFVDKRFFFKTALLLSIQLPAALVYLVDGVQYFFENDKYALQYNFNNMLNDSRTHLYLTTSTLNLTVPSISNLFISAVWLERELADFSGIFFDGLVDTRRLLLDYFQPKQHWETHVSNERAFNNSVYEVSITF